MSNKAKSKRFPLHGNISMYNFAVSKLQHDAFCKLYVSLMACVFFFNQYCTFFFYSSAQITEHFDICQFLCLIWLKATCFVNNPSLWVSFQRKSHP